MMLTHAPHPPLAFLSEPGKEGEPRPAPLASDDGVAPCASPPPGPFADDLFDWQEATEAVPARPRQIDRQVRVGPAADRHSPVVQRRLFRLRLDHALVDAAGRARPLALLTIDLEGFQGITEVHGPDVGDKVLQIVAARLRCSVRAEDVVSRIGVQEFGCLLEGEMSSPQLCRIACKVFDAASAVLRVGALWLQTSPSIGIAHGNACAAGAAGMLLGANRAMLLAKQQDIGYAFFEPPLPRSRRTQASPGRIDTIPLRRAAAPNPASPL